MYMNKTNIFVNNANIVLPKVKILLYGCTLIKDWSRSSPVRPHWRFYWNPEPGAEVSDKKRTYCLDKDFMLVIPPGVRVRQHIATPCRSLYVHAELDLVLNDAANRIFTIPLSSSMRGNIERLSETFEPFAIGEFVFSAISRLPSEIWLRKIEDPRIEKVCRLLKEQPERAWKNRELAIQACFSENAFIRKFREVKSVPPQLFIRKLRLEKAAVLLLKNELSIEEIAAACGFCDRHYFTRMFKKHFRQSPGRFRISNSTP